MATANPSKAYAAYQEDTRRTVIECIERMGCQPILFVGSGLSKRYFDGPNWTELLMHLARICPVIDKDYAFYEQSFSDPTEIGEHFAGRYHEWAWSSGRSEFPERLFSAGQPRTIYIKHKTCEYFNKITENLEKTLSNSKLSGEIAALKAIKPHAIITTNYDSMLESIFPDYVPVVGQQILQGSSLTVGEIFKIHGSVADPNSIVLTKEDYEIFQKKKKYLSAKLLTFFRLRTHFPSQNVTMAARVMAPKKVVAQRS